jgi:nicotinate-nucleotide pyrophosphorylase (carboxylating)
LNTPRGPEKSEFVRQCLSEDLGAGDLTAKLIPEDSRITAQILSREPGVLCGTSWADEVFQQIDVSIVVNWLAIDTENMTEDQVICTLSGPARGILTAERTALNLLQTLSATASVTRRYCDLIAHTNARILDTRKTIPGLRNAQKYAVVCGGGMNHRMGLYDGILIKENHLRSGESIPNLIKKAFATSPAGILLEVEVESLEELKQVAETGIKRVLLDNFTLEDMAQAVSLVAGQIELEASGDIDEENIREVAETGVNFISIGALTKNVRAHDLSLLFEYQ